MPVPFASRRQSRLALSSAVIEKLEERRMLSVTISNGRLMVIGTTGDDTIIISLDHTDKSMLLISESANNDPPVVSSFNIRSSTFNLSSITVVADAGNDWVQVDESNGKIRLAVTVDTGPGDDTIFGGSGNDAIFGGDGNSEIHAGSGNAYIATGDGNVTVFGGKGNYHITLGAGDDTIYGGRGQDTIHGGSGQSVIYGGTKASYIVCGPGNTLVIGGEGRDTILGGVGDDTIFSGGGADIVYGGSGSDEIHGGSGNDQIIGGGGISYLDGGRGDDSIAAGNAEDTLVGSGGINRFFLRKGQSRGQIADLTAFDTIGSFKSRVLVNPGPASGAAAVSSSNPLTGGVSTLLKAGSSVLDTPSIHFIRP